jgi:hypothetical protein
VKRAGTFAIGALLSAGIVPAFAAPASGTYDARLCVTQASQAQSCGPAQARLAGRRLRVQVSDIEYRLQLKAQRDSGRLEVALMHGTMQIDEFSAPYEWIGSALRFNDADKQTRYEVQFGERQRGAK